MMLDHTPAPGAAPRRSQVLSHALTEAKLVARNGEQLVLALVIPVALLVGARALADRLGVDARTFPASVLALALFSTTFTSLAIATAFERRYGVLERLAATPLGRNGLLAGKAVAFTGIAAVQMLLLAVVALALGWRPALTPLPWLVGIATAVAAGIAFANIALVLAGRLRAEGVLGVANLVYILLAGGGAVVLPLSAYPGWLRPLLAALPTGALGEGLRNAASGVLAPWPLLVTALWALLATLLARKAFRWMQ